MRFPAGIVIPDEEATGVKGFANAICKSLVFCSRSLPFEMRMTVLGRNESVAVFCCRYGLMVTVIVASVEEDTLAQSCAFCTPKSGQRSA